MARSSCAPLLTSVAVHGQTTADVLVERLRDAIAQGTFLPGEALRQEDISERYGVSRIPLREALRRLEGEGLIVYAPNRGATVAVVTPRDLAEIFQIRRILETGAIRAALSSGKIDLDRAKQIFADLSERGPTNTWPRQHARFHSFIYAAGGNERLVSLIFNQHVRLDLIPGARDDLHTFQAICANDDPRILAACKRGDADAAERHTVKHLQNIERFLRGHLQ